MTGYCCIFSIQAPSAALAGDAGRGDHAERGPADRLRRGGEREFRYAAYRTRVGSPARAFVRVCRSSRPHPTSSGSGRGGRVLGSEAPPVKIGRRPRFPDEGPPPPLIGGSSAGRRSRSCASPRQRPAAIGRLRPRRGPPDAPGPADGRRRLRGRAAVTLIDAAHDHLTDDEIVRRVAAGGPTSPWSPTSARPRRIPAACARWPP